jgi:hypothetical protein
LHRIEYVCIIAGGLVAIAKYIAGKTEEGAGLLNLLILRHRRRKALLLPDAATEAKALAAGASSPAAEMWEQANWAHIEAEVKRLQMRIAKAVREGRWGKAQALQRLLTRSHSGKMLAVKRVTENSGKRTPGVDGRTWLTPAGRWKGMLSLQQPDAG